MDTSSERILSKSPEFAAHRFICKNRDKSKSLITPTASLHCMNCMHRKLCIAKKLRPEVLEEFSNVVIHSRPLRKGRHLYWQDSPFKSVYIVHSGAVKVYRVTSDGEERVLGFHLPGELIGTDGLYNQRYVNSAMTLDTTMICELPFKELSKLFGSQDSVQTWFLSKLYREVLEEQHMNLISHKTAEERVAAFLVNLFYRYQKRGLSAYTIQLLMNRKDIASYLGLANETISRILTRFQERHWLEVNGRELKLTNTAGMEAVLRKCHLD